MHPIGSFLKYHLRSVVYRNSYLRVAVLSGAGKRSRSSVNSSKEYWDSALSGRLNTYLGDTIEVDTRNALMSTLIHHYAPPNPRVLDIGCAGGSLRRVLRRFTSYLGVDISPYAVEQSRVDPRNVDAIRAGKVTFLASDLCDFPLNAESAWDVVVFNEVLYYLKVEDAVKQVARYRAALGPDGLICVSMKDDGKSQAIFENLAHEYVWKDGLLWQSKSRRPEYRVKINRESPAFLLAALAPRDKGAHA